MIPPHFVSPAATTSVHALKIYTVAQVTGFQETAGNFAASHLAAVEGLQFYLTGNGKVANVFIPNTFYGTVSGRYSAIRGHKNTYQFSATETIHSVGTLTYSYVKVVFSTDSTGHPNSMAILSNTGNSLNAVVLNSASFHSGVTSSYTASVTLH